MNKNTTILLGAIAVIAIGAGAYVSMSKPTDEGFSTQSFRKTVQSQPTTTVSNGGNEDGGNGDVAGKPIVKYNSDQSCSVTFDDGVTQQGTSTSNKYGVCCELKNGCYSGKEPGVSGVNYGTQPAEEKVMADFTTQSVKRTTKNKQTAIYGNIETENDNYDMGITVKINSDNTCSVTFDDGVTLQGSAYNYSNGTSCCGDIQGHGNICYSGREPGVAGVDYGTQPVEEKVMPEFTTQSARKTTHSTLKNIQTEKYGDIDIEGNNVLGITIKYNSDASCSVTFDDGVTLNGNTSSMNSSGKPCCDIESHDTCYNGREPGVAGVDYGTQPAEKKVMAKENYY